MHDSSTDAILFLTCICVLICFEQVRVACLECILALIQSDDLHSKFRETLASRVRVLFESEKTPLVKSHLQSVLAAIETRMDITRT